MSVYSVYFGYNLGKNKTKQNPTTTKQLITKDVKTKREMILKLLFFDMLDYVLMQLKLERSRRYFD